MLPRLLLKREMRGKANSRQANWVLYNQDHAKTPKYQAECIVYGTIAAKRVGKKIGYNSGFIKRDFVKQAVDVFESVPAFQMFSQFLPEVGLGGLVHSYCLNTSSLMPENLAR